MIRLERCRLYEGLTERKVHEEGEGRRSVRWQKSAGLATVL